MTDMPVARPPRSWELQTAVVLAAIAVAALVAIVLSLSDLAILAFVRSSGASGMTPFVAWIVEHIDLINGLSLFAVIAYTGGWVFWRRRTRAMLARIGDVDGKAITHWAVVACYLAIGVAFLLRLNGAGQDGSVTSKITFDAVQEAVRAVGISLLLLGVWQIRTQVRAAVVEAGVLLRRTNVPKFAAVTAAPLAAAVPSDLRAADDGFWAEVSELAASTGADLPLLEATGPLAHRWHLVGKSGEVGAVRADIPSGAVVTVFADPPAEGFTPPEAAKYHSFLETSAGDLQYQSVTDKRVPAFLARTRGARRWALYPAEASGELRAVTL
ncbi:hypothetical protein HH310_15905 [Actinoplanes sp. TBRC 11911]|uniref:hypothetical protein n=1 Tax=Actinoplanes sp. TBRC 11911 TaxID=2729386 RepID=UPI00145E17E1|nr:hypothetical protein [Actinoplanes sp. TBRC 11911]NMO52672.1 hypothetical protein [Actinoplanes sp. TBRC 11911]